MNNYVNYIKEFHAPKASAQKNQEIEQNKQKLRTLPREARIKREDYLRQMRSQHELSPASVRTSPRLNALPI